MKIEPSSPECVKYRRCPNVLPKRLGRTFPEEFAIRDGEPAQIPESQREGNLGDGRPVLTARAKMLPRLVQSLDAKVLLG